jgi:anti-sigma-K factor RskA
MSAPELELDCEQGAQAAAYVLGALEPREAEGYREHLRVCAICREEVDELQPAADALPGSSPRIEASAELIERIMGAVRSEAQLLGAAGAQADRPPAARRRWRPVRVAALAAAATMAAGIAVGALVIDSGSSPAPQRVTSALVAGRARGGHAELRQSGTRAELVVSGIPQPPTGKVYQVWLARAGAPPRPTDALFSVTARGRGVVDVPGSLRGVQRLMVTAEPLGGSPHPTSAPIIIATLGPS